MSTWLKPFGKMVSRLARTQKYNNILFDYSIERLSENEIGRNICLDYSNLYR